MSREINEYQYIDECEARRDEADEMSVSMQKYADNLANIINTAIGKYNDSWKYFGEDFDNPEVFDWFSELPDEDVDDYYDAYDEYIEAKESLAEVGETLETNIDKLRTIVESLRYLT